MLIVEVKMDFFCVLFLGHILGVFYFQSNVMAEKKNNELGFFLKHCVIYSITSFICIIPIFNLDILIPLSVVIFSHCIIDLIKRTLINKNKAKDDLKTFCFDQILHISIICILTSYFYDDYALNICGTKLCDFVFGFIPNYMNDNLLRFIVLVLFNIKPVSIFIKKFNINRHSSINTTESSIGADDVYVNGGMIIGILERLIIIFLLVLEQYTTIALVLTAKSITRYKGINEEVFFSDYYLIGTLLSVFIAISTSLLLL